MQKQQNLQQSTAVKATSGKNAATIIWQ